jgi:hypothetical protein
VLSAVVRLEQRSFGDAFGGLEEFDWRVTGSGALNEPR